MDNNKAVVSLLIFVIIVGVSSSLTDRCTDDFQKVSTCLNYATGKAPVPTKECCTSVEQIRGSDPVCLCYIIVQTHNGSESVGIQESRLLQLPTACNLANASLADCPRLLNLPSTSPDNAIFTNSTSASSTSSPSTNTGSSTPSTTGYHPSFAYKSNTNFQGLFTSIIVVFLFSRTR